jgi:hypothetical protein
VNPNNQEARFLIKQILNDEIESKKKSIIKTMQNKTNGN